MKDFCFENNNNNYSSIVHGDIIIRDNYNNFNNNKIKESTTQQRPEKEEKRTVEEDSYSVYRQLTENNYTKNNTCKTILNEHDIKHAMLQANQVNLKNSLIHGTAKNQFVNLNFFSTDGKLDQRKNLEKLSLQYVLSKGKDSLFSILLIANFNKCLIKLINFKQYVHTHEKISSKIIFH